MVQAIPASYAGVTPYLIVRDAARMLDFYKKAFGATEVLRLPAPGGRIGHAEIKIGEGMVMLADESPEMGHKSPLTVGATPITLMFYVPDVDARFGKAIAGATVKHPPRTSSTATAAARSPIRPGTSGRSPRTPRTCRPMKWTSA